MKSNFSRNRAVHPLCLLKHQKLAVSLGLSLQMKITTKGERLSEGFRKKKEQSFDLSLNPGISDMDVSFKYWDDCTDPQDLEAMWADPDVRGEWTNAGESPGSKIHLSRDPDGQPYLTQTEMKAVAGIIVSRHFVSQIESDILCAIVELESNRQPLATRYNKKSKDPIVGIMQISSKTTEWLVRDLGFRSYEVEGDPKLLYKPFVNVYFGAAYLKWLSNYDDKERSEEFMVRTYRGGTKKATHKSTLNYWKRYISVKQSLPSRKYFEVGPLPSAISGSAPTTTSHQQEQTNLVKTTWDLITSNEDMNEMWNHPLVRKEWTKSGEKRGNVRLSHDMEKRPYLSRVELRAVSEIILKRHFSTKGVKPAILCALAEVVSLRFLNGIGQRVGLMGIDYPTARWLYKDGSYKAYMVESVEDLTKPFASMYFGAAYVAWLSEYEGRARTPQFVVQAYLNGPKNVKLQDTGGPVWLKFEETLSRYEDLKKEEGSCVIM